MNYALVKSTLIEAKYIREESYVTITDEEGAYGLYSKSVYDAALEVSGEDEDLFQIVYLLLLNSEEDALEWANS